MPLDKYRKMRDFAKTAEPAGKSKRKSGRSYVIQKHAASHLHYDFRLEHEGVLWSWAVPKGPSLDPGSKRLAVQTEDHPIEYGGFEGTIPESEYGGGTVMVWDRGTWDPEHDAQQMYDKGHLTFQLHGEKLRGGWHLVRTQRGWLLFKATDDAARPGDDRLLDEQSKSALSGLDLDEIAAGKKKTRKKAAAKVAKRTKTAAYRTSAEKRSPMPEKLELELATLVAETPVGVGYLHEVKFDGYRVLARLDAGEATLVTRGGEDWTERMPGLAAALPKLKAKQAILDGELVALDERGVSDFQLLQNSFSGKREAPLAYYAFDLLFLDGHDLRPLPLIERKAQLKALLAGLPKSQSMLRYSDHTLGNGTRFFEEAVKLGLEGVVSKRADAPYRGGRGKDWLKSKGGARQEFVIVGYTEPGGSRAHLGALLLGLRRDKQVVYAGRVGTGFSERSLKDLKAELGPLEIERPRLENAPKGAEVRGVHWVKPKLVAEIAFAGFTQDGLLRHPTFKGLREDKPAEQVVLEQPQAVAARSKSSAEAKTRKTRVKAESAALSHPDKVLYPELGISKRELAEYFELVSELMLPQVRHRPLTLLRCPEGTSKQCFFQKHPGKSLADGLIRVQVPSSDGNSEYATIDDERGLWGLAQMGVLEAHIWGAHAEDAEHPDQLVFDLDPDPSVGFGEVMKAARAVRQLLEDEYGLKSWLKTTGGKGLHVTVPITPRADWDEAKAFCREVAEELTRRDPERYIATMSKAKRKGKIFIDYLRNARGQTFVAPYSPRAREAAGIAMPIEWEQLTAKLEPSAFNVRSAAKYLAKRKTDPFASLLKKKQQLPRSG